MASTARLRRLMTRHRFVVGAFLGALVALTAVAIPAQAQAVRSGDLQVVVRATGALPAASRDYALSYTCTDGQDGTVAVTGSGRAVSVGRAFPVGTRCTVTADADQLALPGYAVVARQGRAAASGSVIITAAAGAPPTAVVEVDYRPACGEAARAADAQGCPGER